MSTLRVHIYIHIIEMSFRGGGRGDRGGGRGDRGGGRGDRGGGRFGGRGFGGGRGRGGFVDEGPPAEICGIFKIYR